VRIKNCVFEENTAGTTGGAISAVGSDNFQLTIEDCSFKDNEAEGNGGGGAIAIQKDMTGNFKVSSPLSFFLPSFSFPLTHYSFLFFFQDCTFETNTAANGGAVLVSDKALVKGEKNTFTSNTARFGGTLSQNLKVGSLLLPLILLLLLFLPLLLPLLLLLLFLYSHFFFLGQVPVLRFHHRRRSSHLSRRSHLCFYSSNRL
jgi:predicted outer membrane repeat protein